ncbi:MAG: SRPBCC domain-containing protein [Acidobacteriota bacterium]
MTARQAQNPMQIVNSRIYKAPREVVFAMFTDAEHISQWWGPRGFSTRTERMDVRPGGLWIHTMISEEGVESPNEVRYVTVDAPRQIVFDHLNQPLFRATVNFVEVAPDRTEIEYTLQFRDEEARQAGEQHGAAKGVRDLLERLEEVLATKGSEGFVIQREFAAPKELVYRAWTEPERLVKWFAGPGGAALVIKKADIRVGGELTYGVPVPDRRVIWVRWIFRELKPFDRLVVVVTFVDDAGNAIPQPGPLADMPVEALSTVTFEERSGKTLMTFRRQMMYANEEQNKAYAATFPGMGQGWQGNLERLAAYLAE